jgi:hypothetical protein
MLNNIIKKPGAELAPVLSKLSFESREHRLRTNTPKGSGFAVTADLNLVGFIPVASHQEDDP